MKDEAILCEVLCFLDDSTMAGNLLLREDEGGS
jgi:hypothetical protein